jgi:hypothetical protein
MFGIRFSEGAHGRLLSLVMVLSVVATVLVGGASSKWQVYSCNASTGS